MKKNFCIALLLLGVVRAYGADELDPKKVRRIPPPGAVLKPEVRAALEADIKRLGGEIEGVTKALQGKPELLELLPDVQIYYKAVHDAVKYDEFFSEKALDKDVAAAKQLIETGLKRAAELREGKPSWTTATGAIVRGYVSKIDGSVQPYGLVVPAKYDFKQPNRQRLDIWYHGRGEDLSELKFIQGRTGSMGEFAPEGAFVLHPYGRYCNANKFAGEVDTFEALDNVKKHYQIHAGCLSVRGFSMGGASTWQFATHFPGLWCAAAPGAGFSETPEFTHAFDPKNTPPTDYEQKLWHIYDSTHYAENLFNVQTVAYSGELDGQKQAADMMTKAMKEVGLELKHVIGPGVKHQYEPKAKLEVAKIVDEYVGNGLRPNREHIKFVTYTLRYNQVFWLTIDGLGEHWKKARVEAKLSDETITATTENVSALSFDFKRGQTLIDPDMMIKVLIDGQTLNGPAVNKDWTWTLHLKRDGEKWAVSVPAQNDGALKKVHGLQGPIDDAFMDSFVMVTPSDAPINAKVGEWVNAEMAHAIEHWRRQFRGEARVVADSALSDAEIKNSNLVLWGDPHSNKVLAKIAERLPIKWRDKEIVVNGESFSTAEHVPILIFPNPLNPQKYVVLNSGFTFRENEYLNNAKQNAKLPDWAVVDISGGANSKWPGKVVKADFFDEHWALKK